MTSAARPEPHGRAPDADLPPVPARPERLEQLPPRPLVTVETVLASLALGAAALLQLDRTDRLTRLPILLVVLACGLVVTNGWTRVTDLPSRKGTALVALTGTLTTTAALLLAPTSDVLGRLPAALAVSVIAAFVHQLLRTDGRPRVVASLSGSLLALAILASGACWVAVAALPHGRAGTAVAALAIGVSAVVETALHRLRHESFMLPAAMASGGVVGLLACIPGDLPWGDGLFLGVVAAGVAFSVRALLAPLPQLVARRAQAVSACASVLAPGALVYAVTLAVVG